MSAGARQLRREQLRNWFQSSASSLSGAYEGALRMLDDRTFPGRLRFIAHAVRDILNRLPEVLDPQLEQPRVDYMGQLDGIVPQWPGLASFTGGDSDARLSIDYLLAQRIDELVKKHQELRTRPTKAELLFRHLMRNEPSSGDVNRRLIAALRQLQRWFEGQAHFPSIHNECDEDLLQEQFRSFEAMLHSFVGDFFIGTRELDDALDEANR